MSEYNVVSADPALREGIARWGREQDGAELEALGALAGGVEAQTWGDQADRNPPVLHTHSPQGAQIDEVDFHPAWHKLLDTAVSYGLTAEPWTKPVRTGAHLRRAAGFVAWSQVEAGHGCPVSMTYAAVPALRASPDLSAIWTPLLASREYDFGLRPHAQKNGVLAGMGMTEPGAGTDVLDELCGPVRANLQSDARKHSPQAVELTPRNNPKSPKSVLRKADNLQLK